MIDLSDRWLDKINQQISHLKPDRDAEDKVDPVDRAAMFDALVKEALSFVRLLVDPYATEWDARGLLPELRPKGSQ